MVVSTLAITGSSILPQAITGQQYNYQFAATGSAGALVWSANGLPNGLSLSPGGLLSGVTNALSGSNVAGRDRHRRRLSGQPPVHAVHQDSEPDSC